MKAVRHVAYGPPEKLRIEEVDKPVPQDKQVLIQVHAASINAGDYRVMRADPFLVRMGGGLLRPKDPRIGSDVAGVVEAVGENVTQFRPGDAVFGCASGSFAEYVLGRESNLTRKPENVTFEQAAALPVAGLTALQMLRAAGESHRSGVIKRGQKIAIQGASGGVGIFTVQLVKIRGAEVTAICSQRNQEMVRSLGADHVIDYQQEDFTRNENCYDFIFGINGYHSIYDYQRALKPGGVYSCVGGGLRQMFQAMLLGPRMLKDGKKLSFFGIAKVKQEDLAELAGLLSAGKIASIIDRTYPLDQIAAAISHVEKNHAQGKVVITM